MKTFVVGNVLSLMTITLMFLDTADCYNRYWKLGVQLEAFRASATGGGTYQTPGSSELQSVDGCVLTSDGSPGAAGRRQSTPSSVGFSSAQTRLCRLHPDHMQSVSRGMQLAVEECQYQLRWRRWNCRAAPVADDDGDIGEEEDDDDDDDYDERSYDDDNHAKSRVGSAQLAKAKEGSRESAFVHALTAAGLMFAVGRACRDGHLVGCTCTNVQQPLPPPHQLQQQGSRSRTAAVTGSMQYRSAPAAVTSQTSRAQPRGRQLQPQRSDKAADSWQWTGCGDNADYGYRFGVAFSDATERETNQPRRSAGLARLLMNLHNNEAGRLAVMNLTFVGCKCHGVSGSCVLKTCWTQLPDFHAVGDRLRRQYDRALRVTFNRHGTGLVVAETAGQKPQKQRRQTADRARPPPDRLVFVDPSPDYCVEADGWPGTRGRRCWPKGVASSSSAAAGGGWSAGEGDCETLCCGRGYNSYRQTVQRRCRCRFRWCCSVECDVCRQTEDVHVCK